MIMSKKKSVLEMTKKASVDAQYRVASEQIGKVGQASIKSLLEAGNFSSDQMKLVERFLASDFGLSLVQFGMGMAIHNMPEEISGDPRAARLAEEFTTSGIARAGNTVIGSLVSEIMPMISGTMASLPEPTRVAQLETEEEIAIDSSKKKSSS